MNKGTLKKFIHRLLIEKGIDKLKSSECILKSAKNLVLHENIEPWHIVLEDNIRDNWKEFSLDARCVIVINSIEKALNNVKIKCNK